MIPKRAPARAFSSLLCCSPNRRLLSSACLGRLSRPRPTSSSITTTPSGRRSLSLWPSSLSPASLWPFGSSKPTPSQETAAPPSPPPPPPPLDAATPPNQAAAASAPVPLDPNPEVAAILSEFRHDPSAAGAAGAAPDPFSSASSILDMPEHIGYLHSLGIDFGWGPSSTMMWVLEHVHVYSGMPWWGSIAATAAVVRIAMLPFVIRQSESMRRMTELSQDRRFKGLQDRFMQLVRSGEASSPSNRTEFATLRSMTVEMRKNAGVRIVDMWIPIAIQLPLGFGMWRVIRTMADLPVPGLETGGILWFTDLATYDPLYILPLINPIALYAMMQANSTFQTEQQKNQAKKLFWFMGPLGAAVTCWMPASMQVYFISTFAFTGAQTLLLKSPRWRSLVGLPPMAPPSSPQSTIHYEPARPSGPSKGMVQNLVDSVNDTLPWKQSAQAAREKNRKKQDMTEEQMAEERLARERRERYENTFKR